MDAAGESLLYSIGEVASLVGVSPAAVRQWERYGFVQPQRTAGGHRLFASEDIDRLRRVQFLKVVEGLTTSAIRERLTSIDTAGSSPTAEPPARLDEADLGPRLRALRLQAGIALKELARRTGLSPSFLSLLERGRSGISMGNLIKVTDALGVTIPSLQASYEQQPRRLVRPTSRPRYATPRSRIVTEDLITSPGKVHAQRAEIAPGAGSEGTYTHTGEELVYVLSGRLTYWIGDREQYDLGEGDALHLFGSEAHRWRNDSDTPTVILWVTVRC